MIEIAICLAIIGIALVAIIGVLPLGINVQKDNRQETLVNQDATVFMNAIRNGARGLDDLTNYVYAISNYWTSYTSQGTVNGRGVNSYTYANAIVDGRPIPSLALTNGAAIIGLLSTPEYSTGSGAPIPNLINGGISNHVVALVHSLSGSAVVMPPQNNEIIRSDSFGYKMICENVPVAVNTPPLWRLGLTYNAGDEVFWDGVSWRATAPTGQRARPGAGPPSPWTQDSYIQQLAANLREVRLTFLWPLLPTGSVGYGHHTFATTVAGRMVQINGRYFFQPQTFTAAP